MGAAGIHDARLSLVFIALLLAMIAHGYAEALLPLFYYFVPLLVLGFILMLFLQEKPLAKTVENARGGKIAR